MQTYNKQRNQRDGGDGGRRAEGAAWGAWLAPDLRDARGAILRRAFALGDARALRALKNCGGRSRDCAERLSSLWAERRSKQTIEATDLGGAHWRARSGKTGGHLTPSGTVSQLDLYTPYGTCRWRRSTLPM
ncbi:hypothetical protein NDU88_004562 [Pleurodeles waltl]|uniref:Uncharacterized protein n=1 Tax=Pleurodeles waltl TaxID=8319 RepID=A0AAV7TRU7_PLEWA|nr:hypothetical protein NDU88_004562 [Pleurodeles waltl]